MIVMIVTDLTGRKVRFTVSSSDLHWQQFRVEQRFKTPWDGDSKTSTAQSFRGCAQESSVHGQKRLESDLFYSGVFSGVSGVLGLKNSGVFSGVFEAGVV